MAESFNNPAANTPKSGVIGGAQGPESLDGSKTGVVGGVSSAASAGGSAVGAQVSGGGGGGDAPAVPAAAEAFVLSAKVQSTGGAGASDGAGGASAADDLGRKQLMAGVNGDGANVITGDDGNNVLVGTAGRDILIAGVGADTLTGGGGSDSFVFRAGDSTRAATDLITDFRSGVGGDQIDVTGLRFLIGQNGAVDLNWGGTKPTAYGVWYGVSDGVTKVYVDTDNNPDTAEAVISLSGTYTLSASDFMGVKQSGPTVQRGESNQAATITGKTGDTLTETDSVLSTSGHLEAFDPDSSAAFVVRSNVNGNNAYGKFNITAGGDWTYTTNTAQNQFQAGKTYTDAVTVTTADGTKQVITVTIVGTNDAAVITGDISAKLVETDAGLSASGKLSNGDIDSATTFAAQSGVKGEYGSFSIDARGNWSYQAGANNQLTAGQTVTDSFTVKAADGTEQVVTMSIVGTNDAPVFGAPTVTTVTQGRGVNSDGNLVVKGSISISDADKGEAGFSGVVTPGEGTLGSLSMAEDGSYTYTVADAKVQYLAEGVTKVETFTVQSIDGTTQTLSFTVTGTNDAAKIYAPSVSTVTEDKTAEGTANLVASGSISIEDADKGQGTFSTAVKSAEGNLGTLALASDGSYTYTVANSATQSLGAGESKTETFTVTSADGTTKDVSFTIVGTNDAAQIGEPTVSEVTEDKTAEGTDNLVAIGSISISDADALQGRFTTVSPAQGSWGTLDVSSKGEYTYTVANSAAQGLGQGETHVDTFTLTSADGTTKEVSFTINGTNDVAKIDAPLVSVVTEDKTAEGTANLVASGSISIEDADKGQGTFNTEVKSAEGNLGTLALSSGGSYTYTVDNAKVQYLAEGVTKTETFTITSADGTSKELSFTITGTNDAAQIGEPTVSEVTEDKTAEGTDNLVAIGSISISDADALQGRFTTVSPAQGSWGTLDVSSKGEYTYTVANSAAQGLGQGETHVDTFTLTSADGTTQDVSFTIQGTNDKPVVSAALDLTLNEDDAPASGSLLANASDADQSDKLHIEAIKVLSTTGTWSSPVAYKLDPATGQVALDPAQFNALGAGERLSVTIGYDVVDTAGAHTPTTATFTVTGTNDAPVVTSALNVTVNEDDSPASGSLLANASDADRGDTLHIEAIEVLGTTGSWTAPVDYKLDPATGQVSLDPAQFNALGAGERLSVTIGYDVVDQSGARTPTTATFTVTGTNDAPVVTSALNVTVNEDDAPASGSLLANASDADRGDALHIEAIKVLDTTGTWSSPVAYKIDPATGQVALDPAQFNALGAGESLSVTIGYDVVDKTGARTPTTATFTVTGSNDAPVIGEPKITTVTEDKDVADGQLSASGTLSITDADRGQAVFNTAVSGDKDNLGTLELSATGSYTYTVDNAKVQYLAEGVTKTETFTVTSADGTTKELSFTITGTNDAAKIDPPTVSELTEDKTAEGTSNLVASGSIEIRDADKDQDTFNTEVKSAEGNLGTLALGSDGSYTYTVANADTQSLGEGDTKVDTFTIQSADGTEQRVSFTITGTNDAAVITGTATASLTETDGVLEASGTLSATDVDSDASFQVLEGAQGDNAYGSFSIDASGHWTYQTNDAQNWFEAGKDYTDTITVTTADGTEQVLTVTITGTNDAAVITASLGALDTTLDETDAVLSTGGTLTVEDVDNEFGFQPQTDVAGSGKYGTFSINAQGEWTYTADSAHNEFKAGETYTDSLDVKSLDGTVATIKVTINGTNDAAVLGAPEVTLTETDKALTAEGQITITDVDSATTFKPQSDVEGKYGSFSVDESGAWSFTANEAYDKLNVGDKLTESFPVESADGTKTTVTVAIEGSNDAAVLSSDTRELTESDEALTASGTLTISDVDSAQTFVAQSDVEGKYGSFSVDESGAWSFQANEAYDKLNVGDSLSESFTVESADGTQTTVSITITGSNDAAVLSSGTSKLTETDEALTASGTLTISDVDSDPTFVAQTDVEGDYGSFSINDKGEWTFTANEAFDALKAEEQVTDSFEVQSADGTKTSVTVTITGTNDAAVITGTATASLTETDGVLQASGTLSATDVDSDASFQVLEGAQGDNAYGKFSIDASGHWTYQTNDAQNWFEAGKDYTDTITVTTADGTEQVLTVTITGTNDAAVITASLGALDTTLDETDAVLSTGGTLTMEDVDNEFGFQPQTDVAGSGKYGTFSINAQGEWTYTADSAHNEFEAGKTYTDSLDVKSLDGTTVTIKVTINGTNDAAVLGKPEVTLAETNEALSTKGQISITDVDSPQTFVAQSDVEGTYGSFSVDESGAWSFTANEAYDKLNVGDKLTESFPVESADGTKTTVTVTIEGSNDKAVITGTTQDDVLEIDTVLSAGGKLDASDVDNSANFVEQNEVAGSKGYGVFSIDSDGYWSYTADTAHNEFAPGVTYTDTLTVKTADGTEQVISVNILGTNDLPVVEGAQAFKVTEDDTSPTVNAFANASDVDEGTTLVVADLPTELPAGVSFDASTGEFTLDLSHADYQQLKNEQSTTVTVNYSVSDGIASVPTSVSWTVAGVNDAPVVKAAEVVALTEDGTSVSTIDALAGASDVDKGDVLSVVFDTKDLPPGVVYNEATHSFTLDPAGAAFQSLGEGVSKTVTVNYAVSDGTTSSPASVSWTITGTNDAPVVSGTRAMLLAALEDMSYTVTREQLLAGFSDVDSSDTLVVTNLSFDHGTITDNGDGTYTVKPDLNYNGEGTLSYTVGDGHTTLDATLALNVTAVNDAPTTAAITLTAMDEDSGSRIITQADLLANAADVDNAKSDLQATGLSLAEGSKGTLVDNEDGTWTYTPAADDDTAVSFNYTITDGSGGTTAGSATLDLTPVDDLSRISGDKAAKLVETNAALTAKGTLVATDIDGPVEKLDFVAQTDVDGSGQYGKFSINAKGEWTYTASSAHDAFKEGDVYTDSITVKATDGIEQTITVTLVGTNDAAVITGKTASQLTETHAVLETTGKLGVTDVDGKAEFTPETGLKGSQGYGTLAITADGTWTYTSKTPLDMFDSKTNYSETVTVKTADGTEQTITLNFRGTNDAPVVTAAIKDAATEDGEKSTVSGLLHASDPDQSAVLSVTNVPTTLPDGVSFDKETNSFTLDASHESYQKLGEGKTTTVTVNYGVTDGIVTKATPASISWTVTGVNDKAEIGSPTNSLMTEDTTAIDANGNSTTNLVATGSISISDVDTGEGFFKPEVTNVTDNLGSLSLSLDDKDGTYTYTYTVDNAKVQYLGKDESRVETFTVTSLDGTTKDVSFTIKGVNDAAVITAPAVKDSTVTEDSVAAGSNSLVVKGTIGITDVDQKQASFSTTVKAAEGTLGSLVLDKDGGYTYTVDNAKVQHLGEKDTLTETFTVTAKDGTTKDISFTIQGSNDKPVIKAAGGVDLVVQVDPVKGSAAILLADGQGGFTPLPVDLPAAPSGAAAVLVDVDGDGKLDIVSTKDGKTFETVTASSVGGDIVKQAVFDTAKAAIQQAQAQLAPGVADLNANGQVDVLLVNTAAGAGGGALISVDAKSSSLPVGVGSDAKTGAAVFIAATDVNKDGVVDVVTASADGSLNVSLGMSYDGRPAGFTPPQAVQNTHGDQLNLALGKLPPAAVNTVQEDSTTAVTGQAFIRDADKGQSGFAPQDNSAGKFGTFTLGADGKWSYTLDNTKAETQALGNNQSVKESFIIKSADGSASSTIDVTITGSNDAPVVAKAEGIAVLEGGDISWVDPLAGVSDPEGQTVNFAGYETLPPGVTYMWGRFELDPKHPSFEKLAAGEKQVVTVDYKVTDGSITTPASVSWTVTGTDDLPVIDASSGAGGTASDEPAVLQFTGTAKTEMINVLVKAGSFVSRKGGTLVIDNNLEYTYKIDPKKASSGQNFQDTVTIKGPYTFNPAHEGEINIPFGAWIRPDGTVTNANTFLSDTYSASLLRPSVSTGQLQITDADNPTASFSAQTNVQGEYGSFSIKADGQWTYTLDKTRPETVALGSNDQRTETFKVMSSDGVASQDVVVTVKGSGTSTTIMGTADDNVLTGTTGSDVINGGAGNDVISGGAGTDYLTGGAGADTFVFNTAPGTPDVIRDFKSAEGDKLELDLGVFANLQHDAQGHLAESIYIAGEGTQTADQHLVFDKATGLLSYDADGGNGNGQLQGIVKLDGVTSLTPDDLKLTGGNS